MCWITLWRFSWKNRADSALHAGLVASSFCWGLSAACATLCEEGTELLTRLKKVLVEKDETVKLPMATSCSPGWIKYIEHMYPDYLRYLSTCKSPQQMFGALAKTYYAKARNLEPDKIVSVYIMPCTAKKYEAFRPEMHDSGCRDVDYVLTTS